MAQFHILDSSKGKPGICSRRSERCGVGAGEPEMRWKTRLSHIQVGTQCFFSGFVCLWATGSLISPSYKRFGEWKWLNTHTHTHTSLFGFNPRLSPHPPSFYSFTSFPLPSLCTTLYVFLSCIHMRVVWRQKAFLCLHPAAGSCSHCNAVTRQTLNKVNSPFVFKTLSNFGKTFFFCIRSLSGLWTQALLWHMTVPVVCTGSWDV